MTKLEVVKKVMGVPNWKEFVMEVLADVEGREWIDGWVKVSNKKEFEKKLAEVMFEQLEHHSVDLRFALAWIDFLDPTKEFGIKYVSDKEQEKRAKQASEFLKKRRERKRHTRKRKRSKKGWTVKKLQKRRNPSEDDVVEITVLDYEEDESIEGTYEFKGCKGEWQDYEEWTMDIKQASGLSDEDFKIVSDILHQASPMFNDEFVEATIGVPWKIYLEE